MAGYNEEGFPFSRVSAKNSFDRYFEHYPEELVDSLYSMWEMGGMPYTKSYNIDDSYQLDSTKRINKPGGSRPFFTQGVARTDYGAWPDTAHIKEHSIDDFVAEVSHGLDKWMDEETKQRIISDHYSMLDTVGMPLTEYMQDPIEGQYFDPNLKRNPSPWEYITHQIIEPWARERFNIDTLEKEWMDNFEDE